MTPINSKYYWLCAMLLLLTTAATAQRSSLLDRFRAANSSKDISYGYKVVLHNMKTGKHTDSTKGGFISIGGAYIDSNSYLYTARSGTYYCQLDHKSKTALIGDVISLGKRVGITIQDNNQKFLFNITDSLLARHKGSYSIDSSRPGFYRLKMRLRDYPVNYIQLDFRRGNYKIYAAYMEAEDREEGDPGHYYVTQYYLDHIAPATDAGALNLSRIFTVSANKISLSPRYARYQLIPLAQSK